MKKKIVYSFFFNILGLGSLWMADAFISSNYEESFISQWALYKSLIFIGATFVTMGMDQAIVRLKLKIGDIFTPFILQTIVLSAIITGLVIIIDLEVNFIYLYAIFILFALSYLFYGYERSSLKYAFAQFSFHLWKIIFLVLILIGVFGSIHESLMGSFTMAIFLILVLSKGYGIRRYNLSVYKSGLITGMHFFLSLSSLNIILYLDQILLSNSGQTEASEALFSHITFYISPAAIVLGFTGFVLAPYLRENPQKAKTLFNKYFPLFVLVGLLTSIALFFVSTELYNYFKGETPMTWLGAVLCGIYFLRYLTILPSSYLGSFASNKLIKQVSIVYHLANVIFVIGYFSLLKITDNNYLLSISLSILVAWLIRISAGYYGISNILKTTIK